MAERERGEEEKGKRMERLGGDGQRLLLSPSPTAQHSQFNSAPLLLPDAEVGGQHKQSLSLQGLTVER